MSCIVKSQTPGLLPNAAGHRQRAAPSAGDQRRSLSLPEPERFAGPPNHGKKRWGVAAFGSEQRLVCELWALDHSSGVAGYLYGRSRHPGLHWTIDKLSVIRTGPSILLASDMQLEGESEAFLSHSCAFAPALGTQDAAAAQSASFSCISLLSIITIPTTDWEDKLEIPIAIKMKQITPLLIFRHSRTVPEFTFPSQRYLIHLPRPHSGLRFALKPA
ncbi:hypothetical protein VTN00DRAFT_7552 [Thermoascus crustaceus]|uniref:uncharacterized protein n=1 Tax=Thermoascus crustaceus TaxID=5088 RepID=UPI0037434B15